MIFLLQARPVKADLSTWWYVSLTALTALEVTTKVESKLRRKNLGIPHQNYRVSHIEV